MINNRVSNREIPFRSHITASDMNRGSNVTHFHCTATVSPVAASMQSSCTQSIKHSYGRRRVNWSSLCWKRGPRVSWVVLGVKPFRLQRTKWEKSYEMSHGYCMWWWGGSWLMREWYGVKWGWRIFLCWKDGLSVNM